jgi:hypothetical protein
MNLLVAKEGYYSKFALLTGATPSKKNANMIAIGK